jgi:hypothetical protein
LKGTEKRKVNVNKEKKENKMENKKIGIPRKNKKILK